VLAAVAIVLLAGFIVSPVIAVVLGAFIAIRAVTEIGTEGGSR
jgi:hypothetical protein